MDQKEYARLVKTASKNSPMWKNLLKAFVIGGAICLVGQGLCDLYKALGLVEDDAKTFCSVTLIFLGVALTAFHLYDKIAKHAGAGTLVPITGFANAVSSPAIEFKAEGMITGLGTKIFVIAGPVIVYGVSAATLYGLLYWLWGMVMK